MGGLFRALNRTKVFRNLTEQEFAWVLYDVGNSAFIMIACSLIPIWFKSLAIGTGPGKISSDQATGVLFDCDRDRDSGRSADRSGLRCAGGS